MKRAVFTLFCMLLTTTIAAAGIDLNSVIYPDGRTIDVTFTPTAAGPDAKIRATTNYKNGQANIKLSYKGLQPAVLFSGDITTYVLWAVSPDGETENLGEIGSAGTDGSARFIARKKDFALIVTAEPLYSVRRASELVVLSSDPAKSKWAKNTSFTFDKMIQREGISAGNASIKGMAFKASEASILIQARKAMELVERFGAEKYNPEAIKQARVALASATNSFKGGTKSAGNDYARRSIELSSQALTAWVEDMEVKAEAERLAREQATKAALSETSAALGTSEDARRELEIERQRLEEERAILKAQRDELARRLSGALEAVAGTQQTARGYVLSFGDINFDTGKATLKDIARLNIAKLSGILLMMPGLNIRVEGHTDSTGSDEINMKLSKERADAVQTIMTEMGVDPARIISEGYGKNNPIAENDSAEGRAKNRRVEIILAEGTVAAPSN